MGWRLQFRPEVEQDVFEAAAWYENRQTRLGVEFVEEIIQVWESLAENPLLHGRRHPTKNIRWCYPARFPYRVIYQLFESEQTVLILAVLHAARKNRHWKRRASL